MTVTDDAVTDWQKAAYIAGQAADARVNVELETEGMTLNIGPQHPATHGTLRIVVRLDGEQVLWADPVPGYMHRGYEKLCEVRKYPQVTTLVNRIDWLGSFANEVPFILAAEQLMGIEAPPARAVHPHDPLRAGPHRQHRAVPRRHGRAARRDHAGLLRLPRPRARAQPHRVGHRRPLPPELRPRRRPQGRPAQGLDRRGQRSHGAGASTSATRWKTCSSATRSSQTRCRGIGVIPAAVALDYGLSGANLRASGVDWDLRRDDPTIADGVEARRLQGVDPPRRRQLRPLLGAAPGNPRVGQDHRPAARRAARRADHDQGPAHHQGARGRGLRADGEPARRDGLLRRVQGRPRPVPGEDPHARASTTSRSRRGCCAACTCPTSSRSSRRSTSSSETSTADARALSVIRSRPPSRSAPSFGGHPRRARSSSSTSSCSR